MPVVEELDIALADGSHRHGQHLWPGWRQEQVDMIVHQNEGMDGDGVSSTGFVQQLAVVMTVFVVDENGGAVDAAGRIRRARRGMAGGGWWRASNVSTGGAAENQGSDARSVGNSCLIASVPFKSCTRPCVRSHAKVGAALRPGIQPQTWAYRHALGGAFQILPRGLGTLPAHGSSLHRTQPGACRHGHRSGALSLVQGACQPDDPRRSDHHPARVLPGMVGDASRAAGSRLSGMAAAGHQR